MNIIFFHKIITKTKSWLPFLLLFIFGVAFSLFFIFSGKTIDEGDNFSVGWLLSEGKILYKDIFSHHFPFPYFYVSTFFSLFTPSVFVARLSLLLFELLSFLLLFFLTKKYVQVSVTYLIWCIIARFFLGNLVLYYSFSGISVFVIFVLTIYLVNGDHHTRRDRFTFVYVVVYSFYSVISILSDPTSILPLSISLLGLLYFTKNNRKMAYLIITILLFIIPFIIYLFSYNAISNFVNSALIFNYGYYLNYNSGSVKILSTILTFLKNFNPFSRLFWLDPGGLPRNIRDAEYLVQWFFGGFYYRIILIVFSIVIGNKRNWKFTILILLFFVSLFFRSEVFFHPIGMILISIYCSIHLIPLLFRHIFRTKLSLTFGIIVKFGISNLCLIMIVFYFSSMTFFSIRDYFYSPDQIQYSTYFGHYMDKAVRISELTCDKVDVKIAFYPSDPYIYFFQKKSHLKVFFSCILG